jgi:DNA protecting protein DprA
VLAHADVARFAYSLAAKVTAAAVRRAFTVPFPAVLSAQNVLARLAPWLSDDERDEVLYRAAHTIETSEAVGIRIVPLSSREYPRPLRRIANPPPFLHVRGTLPASWELALAVIGTRTPDLDGISADQEVVAALAKDGRCIVVSGLAAGIDAEAHRGALAHGLRTVAVLGSGLDVVHPPQHIQLAEDIISGSGCLLSEIPVKVEVTRLSLVARDRIQSGLSIATILIQSELEGGSMHTAAFTLAQNRCLIALTPQAQAPSWSGNLFLLDKRERQLPRLRNEFKKFERPLALEMPRHRIASFVASGLESRFDFRRSETGTEPITLPEMQ